jgi:hypothetical protein
MNNQMAKQNDETTHLKNVYEQSLALLSGSEDGTKTRRSTILRNAVPLHIDAADLQKRALDAAAKALATLWKVPAGARLNGPLHYSR